MSGVDDIHFEPVRGLPERLPAGETMLWQGSPDWRAIAIDVFHVRAIWFYGLLLIVWRTAAILHDGGTTSEAAIVALWLAMLPVATTIILSALAVVTARSTVYTITNRRVVMRIGVALTVMMNLPYRQISSAAYKAGWFGTGDIPLSLSRGERIGYLVLWPHARPWAMRQAEPMLRGVPDGARVANILARALADSTNQAARQIEGPVRTPATVPVRTAAAAG